jgi:CBS-domain-containing membrane protein
MLTISSGDRLLMEALQLMSDEGLTSVAVVDNALNVVGNISTADVKLLTTTSSLPLLKSSCFHFISVILSERGIGDGKDAFPGE